MPLTRRLHLLCKPASKDADAQDGDERTEKDRGSGNGCDNASKPVWAKEGFRGRLRQGIRRGSAGSCDGRWCHRKPAGIRIGNDP